MLNDAALPKPKTTWALMAVIGMFFIGLIALRQFHPIIINVSESLDGVVYTVDKQAQPQLGQVIAFEHLTEDLKRPCGLTERLLEQHSGS